MPVVTPKIPDGMIEIMKGLAKGVLKEKPDNVYEFAADYFEKLIIERDGELHKGYSKFTAYSKYAAKLEAEELTLQTERKRRKQQSKILSVPAMEAVAENSLSPDQLPIPDSIGESSDKSTKVLTRKSSSKKPADNLKSIAEETSIDVTEDAKTELVAKLTHAATLIQAVFRSYMVRKKLAMDKENNSGKETDIKNRPKVKFSENMAAFIIQNLFKKIIQLKRADKNQVESGENFDETANFSPENVEIEFLKTAVDSLEENAKMIEKETLDFKEDFNENDIIASGEEKEEKNVIEAEVDKKEVALNFVKESQTKESPNDEGAQFLDDKIDEETADIDNVNIDKYEDMSKDVGENDKNTQIQETSSSEEQNKMEVKENEIVPKHEPVIERRKSASSPETKNSLEEIFRVESRMSEIADTSEPETMRYSAELGIQEVAENTTFAEKLQENANIDNENVKEEHFQSELDSNEEITLPTDDIPKNEDEMNDLEEISISRILQNGRNTKDEDNGKLAVEAETIGEQPNIEESQKNDSFKDEVKVIENLEQSKSEENPGSEFEEEKIQNLIEEKGKNNGDNKSVDLPLIEKEMDNPIEEFTQEVKQISISDVENDADIKKEEDEKSVSGVNEELLASRIYESFEKLRDLGNQSISDDLYKESSLTQSPTIESHLEESNKKTEESKEAEEPNIDNLETVEESKEMEGSKIDNSDIIEKHDNYEKIQSSKIEGMRTSSQSSEKIDNSNKDIDEKEEEKLELEAKIDANVSDEVDEQIPSAPPFVDEILETEISQIGEDAIKDEGIETKAEVIENLQIIEDLDKIEDETETPINDIKEAEKLSEIAGKIEVENQQIGEETEYENLHSFENEKKSLGLPIENEEHAGSKTENKEHGESDMSIDVKEHSVTSKDEILNEESSKPIPESVLEVLPPEINEVVDVKIVNGKGPLDQETAATIIQKNYRGYRVRRDVKTPKRSTKMEQQLEGQEEVNVSEEKLLPVADDSENKSKTSAATVIQSVFRGYLARKMLKEKSPSKNNKSLTAVDTVEGSQIAKSIGEVVSSSLGEAITSKKEAIEEPIELKQYTQLEKATAESPQSQFVDIARPQSVLYDSERDKENLLMVLSDIVLKELEIPHQSDLFGSSVTVPEEKQLMDLRCSEVNLKKIDEIDEVALHQHESHDHDGTGNNQFSVNISGIVSKHFTESQEKEPASGRNSKDQEEVIVQEESDTNLKNLETPGSVTEGINKSPEILEKPKEVEICQEIGEEETNLKIQGDVNGDKIFDENDNLEEAIDKEKEVNENVIKVKTTVENLEAVETLLEIDSKTENSQPLEMGNAIPKLSKEEIAEIENFDFSQNEEDSLEAMYYSIKKNELMLINNQTEVKENGSQNVNTEDDAVKNEIIESRIASAKEQSDDDLDDDDIVVGVVPSDNMTDNDEKAKELNNTVNVEATISEQEIESMLNSDGEMSGWKGKLAGTLERSITMPDNMMNPIYHSMKRNENLLNRLHGIATEVTDDDDGGNDDDDNDGDEKQNNLTVDQSALMRHESDDKIEDMTFGNIQRNILASSISEADSDYFDPTTATPASLTKDDFNISTALEKITSTDTESTIVSAATKIQAGARGFITRRRLRRSSGGTSLSERPASFGNAAIDKSLDDLIEREELKNNLDLIDAAVKIQRMFRDYRHRKQEKTILKEQPNLMKDYTVDYQHLSDEKSDDVRGITEIKLEQRKWDEEESQLPPSISLVATENEKNNENILVTLYVDANNDDDMGDNNKESSDDVNKREKLQPANVTFDMLDTPAARRMTLQRGDAVQRNSTPDSEAGGDANSPRDSNPNSPKEGTVDAAENHVHDVLTADVKSELPVAVTKSETINKTKNKMPSKIPTLGRSTKDDLPMKKSLLGPRQKSMPVQIDSDVMRVVPKHLRKRIKSAGRINNRKALSNDD